MKIGIDLGGTKIEGIVMDARGRERSRRRMATPAGDYEATLRAIAALVRDLEEDSGAEGSVGVGTPGAVSPATGLMKNCNSTWLNGRSFPDDLQSALGRPVRIANDADCFALSEAADGAAAGADCAFGVILGTGVGGGIVVRGRSLHGPNAIAGEWGHNPLPWPRDDESPGPPCYCGLAGCIETFLSGPGLALDFERATGERRTAEEIASRAAAGDAGAAATVARYEERLARALASVINVLDPGVIVLGGGVSRIESLYANIPRLWGAFVFSDTVATRLMPAAHGDSSGVRGAARLWDE